MWGGTVWADAWNIHATFKIDLPGSSVADGICFFLHNDPRGAAAIGGGGGALGFTGVSSSIGIR